MSLITMGWGHLTVITMGLGTSFRIQSVPPRYLQRGTVRITEDTPDIDVVEIADKPVSIEVINTEVNYD